jgi:RimJ/RimL family protein N-acetyltransferase
MAPRRRSARSTSFGLTSFPPAHRNHGSDKKAVEAAPSQSKATKVKSLGTLLPHDCADMVETIVKEQQTPAVDLPIGDKVSTVVAKRLAHITLAGHHVQLIPLDPASHAADLFEAVRGHDEVWTYLFDGPFHDLKSFRERLESMAQSDDPLFFAIMDSRSGHAVGYASYMRIEPGHRVIEVGSILFAPALQRTQGATEAMYLMAKCAFDDLGYRRYEWKCNSLNAPSRRAALRLGFKFEGIFRKHMIVKGRNRDTAWYSMTDEEWPSRKMAFEKWLDPSNFDANGGQLHSLSEFRNESKR